MGYHQVKTKVKSEVEEAVMQNQDVMKKTDRNPSYTHILVIYEIERHRETILDI